jgi:hypothetical protein
MEQISNAFALAQLQWGDTMTALDSTTIRHWLDHGHRPPSIHYPDVAAAIVDWVLDGEWADQSELWETLWACTRTRAVAA